MTRDKLSEEQIKEIVEKVVIKELPKMIEFFQASLGLAVLAKEAEKERKRTS